MNGLYGRIRLVTLYFMKRSAYILSLLMLSLMVQPLLVECQAKNADVKISCGANSCKKEQKNSLSNINNCKKNSNKDCDRTNACNPFASCSQSHYTTVSKFSYNGVFLVLKNNPYLLSNESTTAGYNGNCWQPPELMAIA